MCANEPENVLHLCMGSACHKLGIIRVLPRVNALLAEHGLQGKVAVKGAFCLGNCSDGIVLKLNDRLFTHVNEDNIERIFESEILPAMR